MIIIKNVELKTIDHLREERKSLFNLNCLVVAEGDHHDRPIEDGEDFKRYVEAYKPDWNKKDEKAVNPKNQQCKNKKNKSIADMFRTEELKCVDTEKLLKNEENPITDLEI